MTKALLIWFAACFAACLPASAQVLGSAEPLPYEVALVSGGPQSDGSQLAGVHVRLAPGWKTYWRVPGPGGIPPRFDWSRSSNLKSVAYIWPAPKMIEAYGTVTLGFEHQLLLPVVMEPKDPSRPIEARLNMDFGVCSDMCIPAQAEVSAQIFEGNADNMAALRAVVNTRAETGQEAGLTRAACRVTPKEDDEFVFEAELDFRAERSGRQLLVVESGSDDIWISETDTVVTGRRVSSQADLVNFADGPLLFTRSQLRMTLIGASSAVDIRGCSAG